MSAKGDYLKSPQEIAALRASGQRLAAVVVKLQSSIRPGVTTQAIEVEAGQLIREAQAESTFKGFHDYPAVSCISINEAVVHGLPGPRIIKPGDIVGLDLGLRYQGWCTDMAVTVIVPPIDPKSADLVTTTREALAIGLSMVKPGQTVGDIGSVIQRFVEGHGYGVVRDLTGHGIGRAPHEPPSIPNFGQPGRGPALEVGMVLAIEPMVTMGKPAVRQLDDGWTIVTVDGSPAAHFEHTVVITKEGCELLTKIGS